jgi:hypothetical protein
MDALVRLGQRRDVTRQGNTLGRRDARGATTGTPARRRDTAAGSTSS